MTRWILVLSGILLICAGSPLLETGRSVAQGDPLLIDIASSTVEVDFPTQITFLLKAEASESVETIELRYSLGGGRTESLVTPEFTPGEAIDVVGNIDLAQSYLVPGVDIVYSWLLTSTDGDVVRTEADSFLWADDRFEWTEIRSDNVIVNTYDASPAFAQAILDSAQAAVDEQSVAYGVDDVTPVRIWTYGSSADFQGAQAPNSETWIAGIALPSLNLILAVLPDGDENEVDRVVPHEMSHQILGQATANPFNAPPTWMNEGLAVRSQKFLDRDFDKMVQRASDEGRLFSIRALNSSFPYDTADASLAYAESYSIIGFILETYGDAGLTRLIEAYRTGVSHDDAARQALGVDLDELNALWKESLGYEGDIGVFGTVDRDESQPLTWASDLLATGTLVMGIAAFAALFIGAVVFVRSLRVKPEEDLEDTDQYETHGRLGLMMKQPGGPAAPQH